MKFYRNIFKLTYTNFLHLYVPLLCVGLLHLIPIQYLLLSAKRQPFMAITILTILIFIFAFLTLISQCWILSRFEDIKKKRPTSIPFFFKNLRKNATNLLAINIIIFCYFSFYFVILGILSFSIFLMLPRLNIAIFIIIQLVVSSYLSSKYLYAIFLAYYENLSPADAIKKSKNIAYLAPKSIFLNLLLISLIIGSIHACIELIFPLQLANYINYFLYPFSTILTYATMYKVYEYNKTQHELSISHPMVMQPIKTKNYYEY